MCSRAAPCVRRVPPAPAAPPRFQEYREDFSAVLAQISELAVRIGENQFAAQFDSARRYLTDQHITLPDWMHIRLPEKNKALFAAASRAWVFGGMGSWNDSPPYLAHEQGLDGDYERLSAALYRQIMLAVLYAVNEW